MSALKIHDPEAGRDIRDFVELIGRDWHRPSRKLTQAEIARNGWIVVGDGGNQAVYCETLRIHRQGQLSEISVHPLRADKLPVVHL